MPSRFWLSVGALAFFTGGCAILAHLSDYGGASDASADGRAPLCTASLEAGVDSGCPAMTATCDSMGLSCGTNLMSDSLNCGACGHACEGLGHCHGGFCDAIEVTEAPVGSAAIVAGVADGTLYFEGNDAMYVRTIYAAPTEIGDAPAPARVLGVLDPSAAGTSVLYALGADRSGVYAVTAANLFVVSKDGDGGTVPAMAIASGGYGRFAFDDRFAYFTDQSRIERAPKLGTTAAPFIDGEQGAFGLVLAQGRVYFADRAQPDAGSGTLRWADLAAGSAHSYAKPQDPSAIDSDGTYLYWNDGLEIWRATIGDRATDATLLATSPTMTSTVSIGWLGTDGTFVYWLTTDSVGMGGLYRVPRCGGDVLTLAAPFGASLNNLALDARFIYFGTDHVVYRIPK